MLRDTRVRTSALSVSGARVRWTRGRGGCSRSSVEGGRNFQFGARNFFVTAASGVGGLMYLVTRALTDCVAIVPLRVKITLVHVGWDTFLLARSSGWAEMGGVLF